MNFRLVIKKIICIVIIGIMLVTMGPCLLQEYLGSDHVYAATNQQDQLVAEAELYYGKGISAVKSAMKSNGHSVFREEYTGDWCAWYIMSVAQNVGLKKLFPRANGDSSTAGYADTVTVGMALSIVNNGGGKIHFINTNYANDHSGTYKNQEIKTNYQPRKGDIVMFGISDYTCSHVGIVRQDATSPFNAKTVEGNTSGSEWQYSKVDYHTTKDRIVLAYVTPNYTDTYYQIEYKLNDGSGNFPAQTVAFGSSFTINKNTPTKSGSVFKCWYLKRLGDQKWYVAGKGWYTWDDIVKNKYKPREYQPGGTFALDNSWIENGGEGSNFRFAAQWMPVGTRTISDGTYFITTSLKSGSCVTVRSESTDDGANVQLYASVGNIKQAWKVKYLNDGYYSIQNVNSDKYLDVNGGGIHAGTNVQQWSGFGDNQRWIISKNSDGTYSIRSKVNGLYLDLNNASSANGTNILLQNAGSGNSQKWNFVEYAPPCTHAATEKRNVTEATCNAEGYSGDTYCSDCGALIDSGYTTSATGHSWDNGTVTTEPTTTTEGIRTYTCIRCGETITEPIAVLAPAKSSNEPTNGEPQNESGRSATDTRYETERSSDRSLKGANKETAEQILTSRTSDSDPAGTTYGKLAARVAKAGKTSQKIKWNRVSGAAEYVVYGNRCGKHNKVIRLATVVGQSFTHTDLARGTYYKYIVVAIDGNDKVIASSKMIHSATKGGKVGNYKKIKTRAKKNKVTIRRGNKYKLKAKGVPESKKRKVKNHRAIKYETSNAKVAKVSSKGVIKGVGRGSCYVYAYAQNGICAKVRVTVK